MSTRVNYTMTPDLTFEFYGQPFVSTGEYSNVREVSDDAGAAIRRRASSRTRRRRDTDMAFKYTQLRTNSVVRWEYPSGLDAVRRLGARPRRTRRERT